MIGDKIGLIDYHGKIQVPIQYEKVNYVFETDWATIYDKGKTGLYNIRTKSFFIPLEYDYIFVDKALFDDEQKPTRIITFKNGIVNILDGKGNILQSDVSKTEVEKNFKIDMNAYQPWNCYYVLYLMVHNKTFQVSDCLKVILKKRDIPIEALYYNMVEGW